MKIAALVSVFLAVVFAVIAVYQIINARRLQIVERIQRYGELTPTKEEMEATGMKEAAVQFPGQVSGGVSGRGWGLYAVTLTIWKGNWLKQLFCCGRKSLLWGL